MPPLSVPTSSALPPIQRIASTNPGVFRILHKLSRSSLLSLVLDWLDDRNRALSRPYLADDDAEIDPADIYPPAQSLEELREYYNDLQARKGTKRDVVDRIIEGDWRNGLSLYQIAMVDMQYLYDHPLSQKWTALKVVQLEADDSESAKDTALPLIPRFHPPSFLQNLQKTILPDVKVHYNLDRHTKLPLLLLRIFIVDSPYNTSLGLSSTTANSATTLDASKTIYVAFPDASPHVFVSLTTTSPATTSNASTNADARSLRKIILDGIPKAFSRPRARYGFQSTNFSAKSLQSMIAHRGGGRSNAAGGGWEIYASNSKTNIKNDTPLNTQLPTPPASEISDLEADKENLAQGPLGMKRRRLDDEASTSLKRQRMEVAAARFGKSGRPNDGKGIERMDVRIDDPFVLLDEAIFFDEAAPPVEVSNRPKVLSVPGLEVDAEERNQDQWIPGIRVTLHGSHVFAGVRELIEHGIIDGKRMPGWMTGENGVSVGVVQDGRIRGFKGSGA
jgi:central kinetochore subunit Mis15/CHL4